ncbi:hypothetical protein [uncultured Shimia sp.]|uniref:hypothetical protein n=1 Tax=uncultured Shimia sp. TaxID=573152 RepID=UPI00260DD245|nr:hypothetical protein [uncultured Shimia sp.]
MFLRIALLPLIFGLSVPAIANAKPSHSLVIHSEENRKYCNDGYTWDATDKMCMADPRR